MSRNPVIEKIEAPHLKDVVAFQVGDTVRVRLRIIEGKKERIQAFAGVVIAKKGTGISETFTVYRNAYGCNMQKVFFVHSPRLKSIEVVAKGKVRRAKLNYVKGASGKAAKIKQKIVSLIKPEEKEMVSSPEEVSSEFQNTSDKE
ncbi:MAG: 50S ribosomal protein L19 [Parachlamydiales bacterium]|nr:50S ribosomal protein L19 [Parachlamydiales bacterium]